MRRHLLSVDDVSREDIERILGRAASFAEVSGREIKKVPTLRGRTVINLFYEASTRTSSSFELAAKRLSADLVSVKSSGSSVEKGESLKDTVQTLSAYDPAAIVIRSPHAGAAGLVARWTPASVINAGDGKHEHPTQALLDLYTLRRRIGSLEGLSIWIVGDVLHSRVARSGILAFTRMGCQVTVCGPPTLIPRGIESLGCEVRYSLDGLAQADVVYALRMQHERMQGTFVPSLREYAAQYQIDGRRLGANQFLMHPGPVNRGVELAAEVIDSPQALITEQVESGVVVRMAVLYELLAGRGAPAGVRIPDEDRRSPACMNAAELNCAAAEPATLLIRARRGPGPAGRSRRRERHPGARGAHRRARARHSRRRTGPRWWTHRVSTRCPPSSTRTCTCARPGREDEEDLDSGTRAAAAGGYCAILAMPNTDPVVDSASVLRSLRERARAEARIPTGFLAAITRGQRGEELTEMAELAGAGAAGFSDDGLPVRSRGRDAPGAPVPAPRRPAARAARGRPDAVGRRRHARGGDLRPARLDRDPLGVRVHDGLPRLRARPVRGRRHPRAARVRARDRPGDRAGARPGHHRHLRGHAAPPPSDGRGRAEPRHQHRR